MKGKLSYHIPSYWFNLNLKLVMGTFVPGIEMSNMAQLLSFLDISNARSLIVSLYIYIYIYIYIYWSNYW